MPYVYTNVATLRKTDKVGSTQCVALVQIYAGAPNTSNWRRGASVLANRAIVPGTAIATFVNGRYLSKPHGNHAALFLRQGVDGFWVMDQWKDDPTKPSRPVLDRFIPALRLPQNKDGSWPRASNNANAFAVIEVR